MEKEITLQVENLELWFDNDYGSKKILNGITFDIYQGAPFHSPAIVRAGDYSALKGSDIVVFDNLSTGHLETVETLKKYGNVSTLSGIINSFTYVGAAISTYGIALLVETSGWNLTIFIWLLISLLGFICCLIVYRRWQKFYLK